MATITVEMDTVSKEFTVKIDGKAMANVNSVSLYKRNYDQNGNSLDEDDPDQCSFTVTQYERDEDESLRRCIQTCAGEKAVETKTEKVESDVKQAISDWYNARR